MFSYHANYQHAVGPQPSPHTHTHTHTNPDVPDFGRWTYDFPGSLLGSLYYRIQPTPCLYPSIPKTNRLCYGIHTDMVVKYVHMSIRFDVTPQLPCSSYVHTTSPLPSTFFDCSLSREPGTQCSRPFGFFLSFGFPSSHYDDRTFNKPPRPNILLTGWGDAGSMYVCMYVCSMRCIWFADLRVKVRKVRIDKAIPLNPIDSHGRNCRGALHRLPSAKACTCSQGTDVPWPTSFFLPCLSRYVYMCVFVCECMCECEC